MITFTYTARNAKTGEMIKSNIEAQNEKSAASLIIQLGLAPISINKQEDSFIAKIGFLNRVRAKDRVLFARQLATLINAGLPLLQALNSVSEQTTSKPLKTVLAKLITSIEGGQSLSSSLQSFPKVFSPVFINLIAAGETSGTLDKALDRIALQQEKDAEVASKVRGAMTYPVIVIVIMIAIVIFMLVKVLPQVQLLYTSFPGAQLPIETRLLLDASKIVTKLWFVLVAIIIGLFFFFNFFRKTSTGKSALDTFKISTPPFKSLFRKLYMARFSRTASTLVSAGVPLLQVLDITSKSVVNTLVEDLCKAGTANKTIRMISPAIARTIIVSTIVKPSVIFFIMLILYAPY